MRNPDNYSIDPDTGNVSFNGLLSPEKGDHSNMPNTTEAYLPGDERGHVNASSLGGINSEANVVPQNYDLNHGAYYSMEKGERTALQKGASIESSKTAVVNAHPGDRPEAFIVSDTVTYADGHTESIHHSFTNASNAQQQAWNEQAAALPGAYDAPNPGDGLRASMNTESYSALTEANDAQVPGISDDYAPSDFSGMPGAAADSAVDSDVCSGAAAAGSSSSGTDTGADTGGTDAGADGTDAGADGADADGADGADADGADAGSADGGASADID